MALRARPDNLSLDHPAADAAAPVAPVHDFSELWSHRQALRQACYRMVGNDATAEDLVQDTYLRALSAQARLEEHRSVVPWLTTVARRRSIDELRFQRRLSIVDTPPEPVAHASGSDDPVQQVVNQELVGRLRQALAELSARERQLLLRQVSHGLSLAELAAEEETSVASVRSVLARARHKLRASLERGGALGALPLPRLWASLRHRWHRWAAHLEGSLPMLTGAGGQALAVVVAVVASLLGGSNPSPWPGTEVATLASEVHAVVDTGWAEAETTASDNGGIRAQAAVTASPPPAPGPAPDPVPPLANTVVSAVDGADQPERATVHHFAATEDGSTILAGASPHSVTEPTIYRSDDSGHSWRRLAAMGYQAGRLLLAPDFPTDNRVIAVGGGALQISTDGGETFATTLPLRGEGMLSPDFAAGDERVFMAGPPPLSYRMGDPTPEPLGALPPSSSEGSIDIGPGWSTTGELLVGGTVPDGTAVNRAAVFSCTIDGCTQRALLPGVTGAPGIITSRTTPGHVIAWKGGYFFVSPDGGTTFSRQPIPSGFATSTVYHGPDGRVYLSGSKANAASGLYVSDDFGATWTAVGQGSMVERGTQAVIALPNGRLLAAPSPGGGVACSTDSGATWSPRCP